MLLAVVELEENNSLPAAVDKKQSRNTMSLFCGGTWRITCNTVVDTLAVRLAWIDRGQQKDSRCANGGAVLQRELQRTVPTAVRAQVIYC